MDGGGLILDVGPETMVENSIADQHFVCFEIDAYPLLLFCLESA